MAENGPIGRPHEPALRLSAHKVEIKGVWCRWGTNQLKVN